jgi:hypothetical protein
MLVPEKVNFRIKNVTMGKGAFTVITENMAV